MNQLFSDAGAESNRQELNQIWSAVRALQTARTAAATTVSEGLFIIQGGASGVVRDGGDFGVEDGGRLYATYPSGIKGAQFGQLFWVDTGVTAGYGLLVQTDGASESDLLDIFRARLFGNERAVLVGQTPAPEGAVEYFRSWAKDSQHNAYELYRIQTHDGADLELIVDGTWDANVDGNLDFDAQGTALIQANTTMQLLCEGQAALGGTTGTFLQPEATGLAANMYMAADGHVYRSTSTARYKTDIRDLEVNSDAVLQLRPRSWLPGAIPRTCPDWVHSQHGEDQVCPAEQGPKMPDPDARRQVGFVAEELVSLGLDDFVEFNEAGQPEAIYYDRLTAALVPLVQRQQDQIDALTEQVKALADRVAALEPATTQKEA